MEPDNMWTVHSIKSLFYQFSMLTFLFWYVILHLYKHTLMSLMLSSVILPLILHYPCH